MQKFFLRIGKMKNLSKNLLYILVFIILLSSCKSVKDGLSGAKQSNSDEFLVEKKNPLITPPEFNKLPDPDTLNENEKTNQEKVDLIKVIRKEASSIGTNSENKKINDSLEKSIIDKIKTN